MTAPVSWSAHAKAIEDEYSQYVATRDIYHDGGLAYRTGDPVPASNVKAHSYDENGLVSKAGTKAAAAATGANTEKK
jgi:hypothetical protein